MKALEPNGVMATKKPRDPRKVWLDRRVTSLARSSGWAEFAQRKLAPHFADWDSIGVLAVSAHPSNGAYRPNRSLTEFSVSWPSGRLTGEHVSIHAVPLQRSAISFGVAYLFCSTIQTHSISLGSTPTKCRATTQLHRAPFLYLNLALAALIGAIRRPR